MRRLTRWRSLGLGLLVLALFLAAGLSGGGWYYSGVLEDGALIPDYDDPVFDLEIVAIGEGTITLRPGPDSDEDGPWTEAGIWGLELAEGYHRVGRIASISQDEVVRKLIPLGDHPVVGQMARLDNFSFPDDPEAAHGITFQEVPVPSTIATFPAWLIDGDGDTWAVFVHGKGSTRQEALRMIPTMVEAGLPSLVITYRNDEGEAASADGYHRYGLTEWEDLAAGVQYALDHGAEDVVLVGYSMGGAIVVSFLYRSPLAPRVSGIILDAPMLDFNATVDLGARQRGAPGILTALGKWIAAIRFDIDWDAFDYLQRVDEIAVPTLLFHGDADDRVPVETSDAFAEISNVVTYVRVPKATHVRSWNTDPSRYESAVRDFLQIVHR